MTPTRRILLLILSGLLLGFASYVDQGWLAGVLGLALFICALERLNRRLAVASGFCVGMVTGLLALGYFWGAYPLEWVPGLSSTHGAVLIAFVWVTTAAVSAVTFASFAWFYAILAGRFGVAALFAVPVLLSLSEYMRAWLYALYTFGEESAVGPYLAIGNLGYTLADSELFLLFARGGIYVLSAIFGALGSALAYFLLRKKYARYGAVVGVLIGVAVGSCAYDPGYHPSRNVTALIASTEIGPGPVTREMRRQLAADILAQGSAAHRDRPVDYVLLPEDTRFLLTQSTDVVDPWLASLNAHRPVRLIDPTRLQHTNATKADALIRTYRSGDLSIVYAKRLLMPIGEYVPVLHRLLFRWLGFTTELEKLEADRNYRRVADMVAPSDELAYLMCFELYSYPLLREASLGTPLFIVNPSSIAVFHGSDLLERQMHRAARAAAVFADVPVVAPVNHGESFIVDRHGALKILESQMTFIEL